MDGEGAAAEQEGRQRLGEAVAGHRSWCPVEAGRAVRHTDQPDPNGLVVNQARKSSTVIGSAAALSCIMHSPLRAACGLRSLHPSHWLGEWRVDGQQLTSISCLR